MISFEFELGSSLGMGVAVNGIRYDSISLVFLEFFGYTLTSISLLNETRRFVMDVIGRSRVYSVFALTGA